MKLRIDVGTRHIERGHVEDCRTCPVALALREQLPEREPFNWSVGDEFATLESSVGYPTFTVVLPHEAQSFIEKFDSLADVYPFAFEIDLPEDAAKYVAVPS